jgi:NAD(P)-dependent dehydrogenase (short-subunit alcohol dehydrogenase family)
MYPDSPFVEGCLAGSTALVTGGTSGIGLEIARCLGEQNLLLAAVQCHRLHSINTSHSELFQVPMAVILS